MIRIGVSSVVLAAAILSAPLTASADVHLTLNMDLVENPTLDPAHLQIVKASHTASLYGVMVNVDPTAKISTKKFTIGGMDLDDASDPMSSISQADCPKYVITIHVWKGTGQQKVDVFTNTIHGYWDDPKTPGHVARCKVKDAWGVAPKVASGPLLQPAAGKDTYDIQVDAGFTTSAWPNNVKESIVKHRKTRVTIGLAQ